MEKLNYQQAYNLIIDAYFKDEIQPYRPQFCFCGTLSPDRDWDTGSTNDSENKYPYCNMEYAAMEFALLKELGVTSMFRAGQINTGNTISVFESGYEEALFNGMCAALEVLKEIHRSRGEDVDNYIPERKFEKRNLISQ